MVEQRGRSPEHAQQGVDLPARRVCAADQAAREVQRRVALVRPVVDPVEEPVEELVQPLDLGLGGPLTVDVRQLRVADRQVPELRVEVLADRRRVRSRSSYSATVAAWPRLSTG